MRLALDGKQAATPLATPSFARGIGDFPDWSTIRGPVMNYYDGPDLEGVPWCHQEVSCFVGLPLFV
jgi:hypothetical protein